MASPAIKSSSGKSSRSHNIGLFDSGVGGLSVAHALQRLLPSEEILYFADQAHFPYGEKSPAQLLEYSRKAAAFLMEREIKLLVIACHTASAYALHYLQRELPIPVIGMIEPTLQLLKGEKRVALLGSQALIRSNIYQGRIQKEKPGIEAIPLSCQELVAVVEEKRTDAVQVAKKILYDHSVDELLLVCTHFSFIKSALQQVMGPDVAILDPAENVAKAIFQELDDRALLNPSSSSGNIQFHSSNPIAAYIQET